MAAEEPKRAAIRFSFPLHLYLISKIMFFPCCGTTLAEIAGFNLSISHMLTHLFYRRCSVVGFPANAKTFLLIYG